MLEKRYISNVLGRCIWITFTGTGGAGRAFWRRWHLGEAAERRFLQGGIRVCFGICKQSVEAHTQEAQQVHSESTTRGLGPEEETCVRMVIKWAEGG